MIDGADNLAASASAHTAVSRRVMCWRWQQILHRIASPYLRRNVYFKAAQSTLSLFLCPPCPGSSLWSYHRRNLVCSKPLLCLLPQPKLISAVNRNCISKNDALGAMASPSIHATQWSSTASLDWALACEDANISTWQSTLFVSLNLIILHLIISMAHLRWGASQFERLKLQRKMKNLDYNNNYGCLTSLLVCAGASRSSQDKLITDRRLWRVVASWSSC